MLQACYKDLTAWQLEAQQCNTTTMQHHNNEDIEAKHKNEETSNKVVLAYHTTLYQLLTVVGANVVELIKSNGD
jgi:hypothetical protein